MATIVVYGGGFQPFHEGHLSSYLQAKKAFPGAAFYVAASNDVKQRPIPFKDKQFLAQQAGVVDPFVETKNPINPQEILAQYDPEKDVYIMVRSERDPVGYTKKDGSPAYYQPYVKGQPMAPFSKHGYVFVTKKHNFTVDGQEVFSGSQVRSMYGSADDAGRMKIIQQLYPKSKQQQMIKSLLDKYLASPQEPAVMPAKTDAISKLKNKALAEQIRKMRPLLKEASPETKLKFMKLMKTAMSENKQLVEATGGTSVKGWASQVRNEHGSDVKFTNDTHGGGTVNRAIARNSQGETVGVYNRNTGAATVFEPKQNVDEGEAEALQYATKAHAGQTRAGGDPYITHPMRVADHIRQYKQSHNLDALISAAYLHDTIEDTDTTQEALHDLFGGLVASLVKELTSDPAQIKKLGKATYLAHKMAAMSSYGLVIKLADRLDNVKDITTAKTPEWRAKYAAETNQILNYIEKTRALSGTHQKLIKLIRDKLAEIDHPEQNVSESAICPRCNKSPCWCDDDDSHGFIAESNVSESSDYLEEK
jgi:hypothetical protein